MTLYEQMQAAGKTAADIEKVTIRTHEACIRIIDKKGPLNNPADRDHCIQYMVAIPLLFGRLTAADYEDNVAQDKRIDALREKINCFEDPAFTADYHDPEKRAIANAILTAADYEDNVAQDKRIDALREKINCFEDPAFTADYHDPEKRAIANAITLEFTDGTRFEEVVVEYPIGHARRRQDGIPLVMLAAVRMVFRNWSINSKSISRASSRLANSSAFWRFLSTELAWNRSRSMSNSTCTTFK